MKRRKAPTPSEAELLAMFFATDDLKAVFGTDDPVEILAAVDLEVAVVSDSSFGFHGFEEEDREWDELVTLAKKANAKLDKKRRAGSIEFLAEKLAKTSRQVREYCKKGLVPGAYQTKGGHWRVRYEDDTVDRVRDAVGGSSRRRSEAWLIKRLRKWAETDAPPSWEELSFHEDQVKHLNLIQYMCAAVADNLRKQGKRITCTAVAKMTGLSRTTVRKYVPHLARGGSAVAYQNNPLVDQYIDAINAKKNGRVRTQDLDFDKGSS